MFVCTMFFHVLIIKKIVSFQKKTVIATYVYASEGSRFALLENGTSFML